MYKKDLSQLMHIKDLRQLMHENVSDPQQDLQCNLKQLMKAAASSCKRYGKAALR